MNVDNVGHRTGHGLLDGLACLRRRLDHDRCCRRRGCCGRRGRVELWAQVWQNWLPQECCESCGVLW